MGHQNKTTAQQASQHIYLYMYVDCLFQTVDIAKGLLKKLLSKFTPSCYVDHKIANAAPIYKSIKMNVRLVPDKNFRTIATKFFQ